MAKAKKVAKKGKSVMKAKPAPKKKVSAKAKSVGSKRLLSDVKIAKLQKLYKSHKYSAQHLCDEFGISMATLFNYLKVKV